MASKYDRIVSAEQEALVRFEAGVSVTAKATLWETSEVVRYDWPQESWASSLRSKAPPRRNLGDNRNRILEREQAWEIGGSLSMKQQRKLLEAAQPTRWQVLVFPLTN